MSTENNTISVKDLTIKYAEKEAIISVNLDIQESGVTAFILSLIHI